MRTRGKSWEPNTEKDTERTRRSRAGRLFLHTFSLVYGVRAQGRESHAEDTRTCPTYQIRQIHCIPGGTAAISATFKDTKDAGW